MEDLQEYEDQLFHVRIGSETFTKKIKVLRKIPYFVGATNPKFRISDMTTTLDTNYVDKASFNVILKSLLINMEEWNEDEQFEPVDEDLLESTCEYLNYPNFQNDLIASVKYENCIRYHKFGKDCNLSKLVLHTSAYLCKNFQNFCNTNQWRQAPFEVVMFLLCSSDLRVYNEFLVVKSVCEWLNYDLKRRSKHILKLFDKFKYAFLTPSIFSCNPTEIMNSEMKKVYFHCVQDHIETRCSSEKEYADKTPEDQNNIVCDHLNSWKSCSRVEFEKVVISELPRDYLDGIYIFRDSECEETVIAARIWPEHKIELNSLIQSDPLVCFGVISNKVYNLVDTDCDDNDDEFAYDVRCFDLNINIWVELVPMLEKLKEPLVRFIAGKLFVFGRRVSSADQPVKRSCQVYIPESGTWKFVKEYKSVLDFPNIKYGERIVVVSSLMEENQENSYLDPETLDWDTFATDEKVMIEICQEDTPLKCEGFTYFYGHCQGHPGDCLLIYEEATEKISVGIIDVAHTGFTLFQRGDFILLYPQFIGITDSIAYAFKISDLQLKINTEQFNLSELVASEWNFSRQDYAYVHTLASLN